MQDWAMSFPHHDGLWTDVAEFIGAWRRPGESVLAPDLFAYRLPGMRRYLDTFIRPDDVYDWAVVHKGELGSLSRPVLERIATGRAVLANAVFVVWHTGERCPAIAGDSAHLRSFEALLLQQGKSGGPQDLPPWGRLSLPPGVSVATTFTDMLFEVALARGRYTDPLSLIPSQAQVYSQNGEDGVIAEIFARIGSGDRFFIEIGVESGQQNNTRLLLEQGWRGIWIESASEAVALARRTFDDWIVGGKLTLVEALVATDNIEAILEHAGAPARFDLLSLDVDQNTGHLWQALRRRSRVACLEYNANLPPSLALQVEYRPELAWDGTSWYGASLKALEQVAAAKGMCLVGCELMGVNAFFVDGEEVGGKFRGPFTAEEHYEPPRYEHGPVAGLGLGHPPSMRGRRWS